MLRCQALNVARSTSLARQGLGRHYGRSVLESAVDDLAHVRAQVRLRGHARDRLARGAAVRLGQVAPAVERARETRGDLRVDGVELDDLLGPEHVALRVAAMECRRVE